jgi:hypothetical protein
MKTFPSHSDLADRLIAIARALPAKGLHTMVNNPVDATHFSEPAITGVDLGKVILKRAVYDRGREVLVVSTMAKKDAGKTSIRIANLDLAKTYTVTVDGKHHADIVNQKQSELHFDASQSHDLLISVSK